MLDFWATWCGPCRMSLPHTNEVAKQFADKGVVVLAVCVSDTQAAFDGWLPKHPEYASITFATDPSKRGDPNATGRLYHVSGIPPSTSSAGTAKWSSASSATAARRPTLPTPSLRRWAPLPRRARRHVRESPGTGSAGLLERVRHFASAIV